MILEFGDHSQVSCNYLKREQLRFFTVTNQPGQHQEPILRRTDEAGTLPGMIERQQSRPQAVALTDQNQPTTDNRS